MNSFKDPLVPLIADPVNIDRPIQVIQGALGALPWIAKSYGRAYESFKRDVNGKKTVYPQVWQGPGLDLLEVMPNDNLTSQSFFKVEEPIEVREYRADGFSTMRARVSAIFWFNLERVDPNKNYLYAEVLKADVQRILSTIMLNEGDSIKILRTWERASSVFAGYTLDETRDQELVYPFGGFRFELEVNYLENCNALSSIIPVQSITIADGSVLQYVDGRWIAITLQDLNTQLADVPI